ncbi:ATP-binding protein [Bacillus salacetis]|uniref:sensor histidine kinase n=1 Tax=Bacillus salacetis TaxID=2315464 RepID=UPI003B9DD282
MKSGIKQRLVWSYLLLIVLTVMLFEVLLLSALRFYYVEGVKQTLGDQGSMFASFYEQELLEGTFMEKAPVLLQRYNFLIDAQVQIYDSSGTLLADTHEKMTGNSRAPDDMEAALRGQTGYFTGDMNDEKILSISQPLKVNDTVSGGIRMVTSMEQINQVFKQSLTALLLIGLFVILIAAAISYFVARTITKPLATITSSAEQMAAGHFSARIPLKQEDELGKLADTLNFMASEIEKHERLKNEFIASVSHELRTPLTSVKGWAITLQSMSEDSFFREGLDIISTESDRLSGMLSELLDLSRLSAGKIEYKFQRVNISQLLQGVVSQLSPRAARQGVRLVTEITGAEIVWGDPDRLKQVFLNILDNSLKFTPAGGMVTTSIFLQGDHILIELSDTGEGIPDEDIPLVLDKFYKGKSKASGTGLGLAICREIIDAHHGTFKLESQAGIGTTIKVNLPAAKN